MDSRDTRITFDPETLTLSFSWWTGGEEGAICGRDIKFKPEAIESITNIISSYKSPDIEYDPDYNEAF